jgi:integrase
VLSDDEVRALWACLEDWEGTGISVWHAAAVKLLLITGQRRQEISELRFEEIESGDLVLGPSRTKNRRHHALPLPPLAQQVIAETPKVANSPFVFSMDGDRPIGGWAVVKRALDAAMAARLKLGRGSEAIGLAPERLKPWRIHDLRRTASTNWARIGVRLEVGERILNHVSGALGGLRAVYNRYQYRSEVLAALELWSSEIERIVNPVRVAGALS